MQELYKQENKTILRNQSSTTFTPIRASVMHSRISSAKMSINSNFRDSDITASMYNIKQNEFKDTELFENLRHAQDLFVKVSAKLNNLRICVMNSDNSISNVVLKRVIPPLCNTLFGCKETAFMVLNIDSNSAVVYAKDEKHSFDLTEHTEFTKKVQSKPNVNDIQAPFLQKIFSKTSFYTKTVELPPNESGHKQMLVVFFGSTEDNINDARKYNGIFHMMLNSENSYHLNLIQDKLITQIHNFIKLFNKTEEQPDYFLVNRGILKIQETFYQNGFDLYNMIIKNLCKKTSENLQILTRENQKYDQLMESTDLYFHEESDSYLAFKEYRLIFKFLNVNAQYLVLNPRIKNALNKIEGFIKKSMNYISNNINLRDRDSLKINFEFDEDGSLVDQTNVFPPGLEHLIKKPMQMSNMNLEKKITLIDLCTQSELLDKLNGMINTAAEGDGELSDNLFGFDILIRVKRGVFVDESSNGYT